VWLALVALRRIDLTRALAAGRGRAQRLIDVNYFYRSTTTKITGRRQVVLSSPRVDSSLQ